MTSFAEHKDSPKLREMLNKVPEITLYFWAIKILCTTVGETAADFLNVNLNFGLTGTSIVTGILLAIMLFFQFKAKKYIPSLYWLNVAVISVFGTLVTDNLTDHFGLPLEVSTLIFGGLLSLTFFGWYLSERTLSIHAIFSRRRETFYWLTVLFTFALGTAAGDLMAEGLGLGYLVTGSIVAVVIALTAVAWKYRLNPVLSFWIIYILTRPLGASIGDFLSQPGSHGGLGLGATMTSSIFLAGIVLVVSYLSLTKRDVIGKNIKKEIAEDEHKGGLWQTVAVIALFLVVGGAGYYVRHSALQVDTVNTANTSGNAASTQATSTLGDMEIFKTITQDTLDKLNAGDQSGATTRISDLEYEWDNAQSRLKSKDRAAWAKIDGKIDTVLRELRAVNPNPTTEKKALTNLLEALQ